MRKFTSSTNYLFAAIVLVLGLVSNTLWAQSPAGIPYQAVVRNPDGTVMANASLTLTFKIHEVSASGAVVFEENQLLTTNTLGLVSCVLGEGTAVSGSFSAINWGSNAKFLQVLMDAGNGPVDLGTQKLMSVPYSLYSSDVYMKVSMSGDTLRVGSNYAIVPGISLATYPLGCMDATACNYDANAGQDDGSCQYQNTPCNDGNVNTGNDKLDATCQCVGSLYINGIYVEGNGVTDVDGNAYTTIILTNGQEWMKDNLAVSKYRNGDVIPHVFSATTWYNTTIGGYGTYGNLAANNTKYGKLYNWYTVNDSRGVCPTGWHVPTDAEWTTFINYLDATAVGGDNPNNIAGGKMKSTGTLQANTGLWNTPNTSATNLSGFAGLPGGNRDFGGGYYNINTFGYWWATNEANSVNAWGRYLANDDFAVSRDSFDKHSGFSIRCLKD
ncbi:MAG: hypothetical protein RL062_16 [Bacteroidota bacterium]|jgi:uncharacterized protein (TIGR02145 family)